MTTSIPSSFWDRACSADAAHNHPSLNPPTPSTVPFLLLLSSPSGLPLYHFTYPSSLSNSFPPALISSLSALSTAFILSNPWVSHLRTPHSLTLFLSPPPLHFTLHTLSPSFPLPLLHLPPRILLHSLLLLHSPSLLPYLSRHPSSPLPPLPPGLPSLLSLPLSHPLSFLHPPLLLPSPLGPSPRLSLLSLLRRIVSINRPAHLLIATASPPPPPRLIAHVGTLSLPAPYIPLLLTLHPEHIYLHNQRLSVHIRKIPLRLSPDQFELFRQEVGGDSWLPEWECDIGGGVVWAILVGGHENLLDDVENALQKRGREVLVSMERPWRICDIPDLAGARGVMVWGEEGVVMTDGGWDEGLVVARVQGKRERAGRQYAVGRGDNGMVAVVWEGAAAWFDEKIDEAKAVEVATGRIKRWIDRFKGSLLLERVNVVVQPGTPLKGFLAPFRI